MKIDNFGQCIYSSEDLFNLLYRTPDLTLDNFLVSDPSEFNKAIRLLHLEYPTLQEMSIQNISVKDFDRTNQSSWFYPDKYNQIDLLEYISSKCVTADQLQRVKTELELYKKFQLEKLLRFLIYLVDTLRENKIVWGVGRGSSVASYVLYLIGLHKVDSLKYNLDINEFLR